MLFNFLKSRFFEFDETGNFYQSSKLILLIGKRVSRDEVLKRTSENETLSPTNKVLRRPKLLVSIRRKGLIEDNSIIQSQTSSKKEVEKSSRS